MGQIDRSHLLLLVQSCPVMEIKWSATRKSIPTEIQFRRLTQQYKRKLKTTLMPMPVPDSWQPHLADWQYAGFCWEKDGANGQGLLLSHRENPLTILVQFFAALPRFQGLIETILASLQCYPNGVPVEWQIFDIRATTPSDFELAQYRFDSGAFRLVFQKKKQAQLILNRWSPANTILAERGIEEFASRMYNTSGTQGHYRSCREHAHCVEWVSRFNRRGKNWRFFGRIRTMRFRVWSLPEKNRLMAASIRSRTGVPEKWFQQVCDNYDAI